VLSRRWSADELRRLYWLVIGAYVIFLAIALGIALAPESFGTSTPDGLEAIPFVFGVIALPAVVMILRGLRRPEVAHRYAWGVVVIAALAAAAIIQAVV
jgi:hypothetical protein